MPQAHNHSTATKKKSSHFSLHIQSNIFFGLFILIPLWLTLFIAYYIFIFLADITYPFIMDLEKYGLDFVSNQYMAYIVSFCLSLIGIYIIGLLAKMWLGRAILKFINSTLTTIPVVGPFYKAIKQLADAFNSSDELSQKKVVLINFPSEQMKTIGFVIKVFEDAKTKQKLASVYVPTTPNPTSGYLEVVPLDKTIPLDWSFEEAMTFIISGGSSMPTRSLSFQG